MAIGKGSVCLFLLSSQVASGHRQLGTWQGSVCLSVAVSPQFAIGKMASGKWQVAKGLSVCFRSPQFTGKEGGKGARAQGVCPSVSLRSSSSAVPPFAPRPNFPISSLICTDHSVNRVVHWQKWVAMFRRTDLGWKGRRRGSAGRGEGRRRKGTGGVVRGGVDQRDGRREFRGWVQGKGRGGRGAVRKGE